MNRKYWILFAITVLPLLFLVSKPSFSQKNSSSVVQKNEALKLKILNTPYDKARQVIINNGWISVENAAPDELVFVAREMYDKGYVEVDMCSPVGETPCNFYFKNGNEGYLKVMTKGEIPHVVSVEVLDTAAFRDAHL